MVVWSSMFTSDGSSASSDDQTPSRHVTSLADALKCYVCGEYFSKPRILPCGHTYCSDCITTLRQTAVHDFNVSRDKNAHRRGDCGFFTCPWPHCHYSMKIMNVTRWTIRNKAMSQAVSMMKKKERELQEKDTQTRIDLSMSIFTLPKMVFTQPSINKPQPYLAVTTRNSIQQPKTPSPPTPPMTTTSTYSQALVVSGNHGQTSPVQTAGWVFLQLIGTAMITEVIEHVADMM